MSRSYPLSVPTRAASRLRHGLVILLVLVAVVGAAWLLGVPQTAYRHAYVWLAYPVELLNEVAMAIANKPVHHIGWGAWTHAIDARYAWLQTPANRGEGPLIALETILPLAIVSLVGWRVFWFIYTRPRRLAPSQAHGSARWMTAREMRALPYRGEPLMLGERDGRVLALDRATQVLNVLLVGPPGTGKSAGFFIPNLRRETGTRSVVVTDLKNELLRKCYGALERRHEVWVLNFLSPATSLGYNPLAYCTDPLSTALFCDAWIANTGKSEKDPFWDNAAREVLLAGIAHLKSKAAEEPSADGRPSEVTLAHLDHFLTGQTPQEVIDELERSPSPLARKKAHSFMASLKANDKLLGSVYAEITPRFMIMADPRVQAVTSTNEVDFRRMVDAQGAPVALFIGLDRTLQKQLRPLIAAFFLDMYRTFSQLADESPDDALPRDVMIYADEFGNLGAIPEMTTWISTLRSAGVYHLVSVQGTSQIKTIYGPDGFETIAASCYTKVGLSNMASDDAEWFSKMSGQTTEVTYSTSAQRGRFHVVTDRGSASQNETKANLVNPDEVQRLAKADLLALIGERPPVLLAQRRYYDDPEVRTLDGVVPPLGPARPRGALMPPVLAAQPAPARVVESQVGEPEHDPFDRVGEGDDETALTGAAPLAADNGSAEQEQPAVPAAVIEH